MENKLLIGHWESKDSTMWLKLFYKGDGYYHTFRHDGFGSLDFGQDIYAIEYVEKYLKKEYPAVVFDRLK